MFPNPSGLENRHPLFETIQNMPKRLTEQNAFKQLPNMTIDILAHANI